MMLSEMIFKTHAAQNIGYFSLRMYMKTRPDAVSLTKAHHLYCTVGTTLQNARS